MYNPYMYGYQMPQQNYQQNISNVQPVDSFEAARSKDIDMSGQARYYPNINGSEIYMRQLQADGTCPTIVFRRVVQEAPKEPDDKLSRVLEELEAIKQAICEPKKTGGAKA